jgi:DNA-binding transcriptional ArsR family regulator
MSISPIKTGISKQQHKQTPPIEDVLSSRGRIKIIKILAQEIELNISEIARRSQLNHSTACRHLDFLEGAGIIQKKVFGRIKIYRFKLENVKVKGLKSLFDLWAAD